MLHYQLWITHKNGKLEKFCFNTAKEAYLYYLDNFATAEDDEYYVECCGSHLIDVADDIELIGCVFKNVFNANHHLYYVTRRPDGQLNCAEI